MLFRDEDEDLEVLPFADRAEAGRMLAGKLSAYANGSDAIVLGLPRGGVTVASAVAGALRLPLDVFVISKIGIPWEQEFAMGALGEGGVQVLDLTIVKSLCLSERTVKTAIKTAQRKLDIQKGSYRGGRPPLELKEKVVIVVDDGIATGCSMLAAIASVRQRSPARVVVAVPVAPASGCNAIRMEADEVISVAEPEMFLAISQWYEDFTQVSDEDVERLLGQPVRSTPRVA